MKGRPVIQGLHKAPMRAMTVKRSVWLTQELNRRVREQHDRLRAAYPSITRNLHEFMVSLIESAVAKLEDEAQQDMLVKPASGPFTPQELADIRARLAAAKDGR